MKEFVGRGASHQFGKPKDEGTTCDGIDGRPTLKDADPLLEMLRKVHKIDEPCVLGVGYGS